MSDIFFRELGMPEEINRKLTDAISDLLCVTEESGMRNLRAEGVPAERIFLVGKRVHGTVYGLRRFGLRWNGGSKPVPSSAPWR